MRPPTLALLLFAALPALAQDAAKPGLPVPRWQVGDTWLVATYVREPTPEGPREAPLARPLAGLNPLRGGVPRGWLELARWRYRVVRQASLRHPEDPRSAAPLRCWVLSVQREAGGERALELWFTAADLRLVRIVERSASSPPRATWLTSALAYAPRLAARLGLPLAWPDLSPGPAERQVQLPGGDTVRQTSAAARPDAPATATFRRGDVPLVRLRFGLEHPWWLELRTSDRRARLLSWSRREPAKQGAGR